MFFSPVRVSAFSLACCWALAGCGDGDALPAPSPAQPDAAASIADAAVADAGTAKPGVQVENAGAACVRDDDCRGADATCLTSLGLPPPLGVGLPGGYCTASCNSSAECGSGGGCPVGDLLNGPPFAQLLGDPPLRDLVRGILPLASLCSDRCSAFGGDTCRPGYVCQSMRELIPAELSAELGVLLFLPAFWTTYCLPPVELPALPDAGLRPDAGAGDAGVPSDAGSVGDAGELDAGSPGDAQ